MPLQPRRVLLVAAVAVALIPSAMLAWRWRAMPQAGIYHDDGIYLVTGRSLASGNGYRIESLPGQPFETKYPPLYPVLLALVWKLAPEFPANLPAFALLSWVMLPALVALAWRYFRETGVAAWEAALLCAWMAVNTALVLFSLLLMSEMLFAVLLLAAVMAAERCLQARTSQRFALVAGLLAGAAFLARNAALPLAVTVPICLACYKQTRKVPAYLAGMLPAVVGWQFWAAVHRAQATDLATMFYTDYFGFWRADVTGTSFPAMVWNNFASLVKGIAGIIVLEQDAGVGIVSRLVALAVIVGTVRLAMRGKSLQFAAFSAAYAAELLVWNYPPNYRFLLPLAPLAVVAFYSELKHLAAIARIAWNKSTQDRAAACAVCALVAAFLAYAGWLAWAGLTQFVPEVMAGREAVLETSRPAYAWLASETPRDAVVLAYSDPMVYLYTGRRGISVRGLPYVHYSGDAPAAAKLFASLPEFARRHGVSYVLRAGADYQMDAPEKTLPALDEALRKGETFREVFTSEGATIYEAHLQ